MQLAHRLLIEDWARFIRGTLEERFGNVERLVLVMDKLNTYGIESLCETYRPEGLRAPPGRLEIHCTPKHASWLNFAELELSALRGPCLNARIPDIDRQFRTSNARVKLRSL